MKHLGSNDEIMNRKIFEQGQIKRAAELGIGVKSASEITLVAADEASQVYRDRVNTILMIG